jgi:hypothetical protein
LNSHVPDSENLPFYDLPPLPKKLLLVRKAGVGVYALAVFLILTPVVMGIVCLVFLPVGALIGAVIDK